MKIFVTSDTHFNHKNIINYNRGEFKVKDQDGNIDLDASIKLMHENIIKNWNSVIGEDDIVIHLGDVGFGKTPEDFKPIMDKLNGKKMLLPGNHDKPMMKSEKDRHFWNESGFHAVEVGRDSIEIRKITRPAKGILNKNASVILSHEPLYEIPEGFINVHGHIHRGPSAEVFGLDERRMNVNMEFTNFTPVLLVDKE